MRRPDLINIKFTCLPYFCEPGLVRGLFLTETMGIMQTAKKHLHATYWKRFVDGDDDAFERLYTAYVDRLFDWGLGYCGDRDLVKDCIQDLFTDLYLYRERLSPDANVWSYLLVSFRRLLNKSLKNLPIHCQIAETLSTQELIEISDEERLISREEEARLRAKLKKEIVSLPSRQQEVLLLRYASQLSYDAVSKVMNISVPTCRTLLSRAIKHLRMRMNTKGSFNSFTTFYIALIASHVKNNCFF